MAIIRLGLRKLIDTKLCISVQVSNTESGLVSHFSLIITLLIATLLTYRYPVLYEHHYCHWIMARNVNGDRLLYALPLGHQWFFDLCFGIDAKRYNGIFSR